MTPAAPARQSVLANPYLLDGAIAVAVAALSLVAVFAGAPDVGPAGIANVVLLMLQALPLAFRRRWPLAVVLVVLGALLAQLAILPPDAELRSSLGPLVALYTAGEQLERRLGIGILIGFGIAVAALALRHAGLPDGLQSVIQTADPLRRSPGSSATRRGSAGCTRERATSASVCSKRSGRRRAGARSPMSGRGSPVSCTTR